MISYHSCIAKPIGVDISCNEGVWTLLVEAESTTGIPFGRTVTQTMTTEFEMRYCPWCGEDLMPDGYDEAVAKMRERLLRRLKVDE